MGNTLKFTIINLIIFLVLVLINNISKLIRNQKRIESKMDRIIDYLEIPDQYIEKINDELKYELIKLVEENKKVKAIKKLKDATGMELNEAKNYVENLQKE